MSLLALYSRTVQAHPDSWCIDMLHDRRLVLPTPDPIGLVTEGIVPWCLVGAVVARVCCEGEYLVQ